MDNTKIWLHKQDLLKMLEVLEKFPNFDRNFQLEYNNTPGLGYTIDMLIPTEVNGVSGELRIPIATVEDW